MSKTALVTGASKGIGLETVRRLATSDLNITTIVLMARASQDYDDNFAELQKDIPEGVTLVRETVDVGDRDVLIEAIHRVYAQVGRIHYLINNAGYTNPVAIHQVEFDDFERTMAVNVYAPFTLVQELLHLGNKFKVIVNIASTAGINGRAGWLTYSASKAAVINMSEVMRDELKIYGTRVVCLSPGRTATALRRVLAPEEDPTTIMQPQHVAKVIETMLGSTGQYIDQQNVIVRQ
ncbi:SDR family oxidoreductase [Demequina sp. B12]|uniref:SDR family NAD(P)-dependent oxidoreductase n=1 Tax=Demequina sp. B12 TaxID=2992757 RepID=UPI00237A1771|nr:SDR family NAD(P)-dependent oxidoreductase [Demequina sp. B12]MDE0572230.1 SDR family oxidoreductase [Demequina sp. B12]